jgi:putative intracellular protease/amidase
MKNRVISIVASLTALVLLAACQPDVPPAPKTDAAASEQQMRAFIQGLQPRREGKPFVAILALNQGTEITDFLFTHGVLKRSGVAEVQAVAPRAGPVRLYPAPLQIEAAQDLASFDRDHPEGADYVIVPAMIEDDDPAITTWLRQQAAKGARVVGVCAGALVVGQAGLLDNRRFVTHWYYRDTVLERHAGAKFMPHQRYVIDRDVATTTGITASIPAMLAMVEAIGGREKAQSLANELGVASWTPVHDSSLFGLDARLMSTYVLDKIAFWRDQSGSLHVQEGMDDITLALVADAWSRTGRVNVEVTSASSPVRLRSGLLLAAQPGASGTPPLPLTASLKPAQQLDRTLCEIDDRYGSSRRERVMMELEYPGMTAAC